MVDDFSISGGTLADIAFGLKDKGANKIYAALSHNVLSAKGIEKIENCPIEFLVATDTLECPDAHLSTKLRTISLRRCLHRRSRSFTIARRSAICLSSA